MGIFRAIFRIFIFIQIVLALTTMFQSTGEFVEEDYGIQNVSAGDFFGGGTVILSIFAVILLIIPIIIFEALMYDFKQEIQYSKIQMKLFQVNLIILILIITWLALFITSIGMLLAIPVFVNYWGGFVAAPNIITSKDLAEHSKNLYGSKNRIQAGEVPRIKSPILAPLLGFSLLFSNGLNYLFSGFEINFEIFYYFDIDVEEIVSWVQVLIFVCAVASYTLLLIKAKRHVTEHRSFSWNILLTLFTVFIWILLLILVILIDVNQEFISVIAILSWSNGYLFKELVF